MLIVTLYITMVKAIINSKILYFIDDCGDSGHLVDSSPEMGLYKHPVTDGQTQCHIIPHQSLSVGDDDVFVDNFDTRRDYFDK
jgi:hypothetical protein